MVRMCIVLLICVHSIRTFKRSEEWKSELDLFRSALKVCPMNAKVHYNLAKSLADIGRTQEAISLYKHALMYVIEKFDKESCDDFSKFLFSFFFFRLHPNYDQAMNNLANILKDQNELEEARSLLEKAVTIRYVKNVKIN